MKCKILADICRGQWGLAAGHQIKINFFWTKLLDETGIRGNGSMNEFAEAMEFIETEKGR